MYIKFYPSHDYTPKEIMRGFLWLEADVTCPRCGKEQSVANTGYVGGPCVRCHELTGSTPTEEKP